MAASAKLGDILALRKEILHPRDRPSGAATFVGLEHIESGTGRRVGSVELDLSVLSGRKPRFRAGDIVYGYLRPYLNKVWVADFAGLCSVDQYVYAVDEHQADVQYVAWFMRSPAFLSLAPVDRSPGQLPRIRLDEVAAVPIPLPALAVQRRIAARLTEQLAAVERARKAAKERVEAARGLARAVVDSGFNLASDTVAASDVCSSIDYGYTASATPHSEGPRFLRITDVQKGIVDWARVPGCAIANDDELRYALRDGDIVFARTGGTTGKSYLIKSPPRAIYASYLIRLRAGGRVLPDYLYLFFQSSSYWRQIRSSSRGGAQPNVNASLLGGLRLPLPGLDWQRVVVEVLTSQVAASADGLAAAEAELAAIEALPAALLRAAFSWTQGNDDSGEHGIR